ncbi:putative cytochrome P450 [Acinetobacter gyllenbergii]|jgi:cytochrome P450|uniref:Cytochrome P450 n=8 Tax=Moraxellaceae TaxID=468 RepID=A0AAX0TF82_ACIBA|nr:MULTISPECIES: cytochrome P450 [Moraxellaceae]AMO42513.1 cytochrome [Acinetobacter sp. DUT-2]MCP4098227.1 cytochrome P450 [Planctomycetaceae bacterium]HDS1307539.1 cytochrome P450 [Stenotrophomonas maltophilia]APR69931.1 cytochrome [Acinetobacter haemolyticus]AZN68638.1 cytochrome P450 [Acinetobacter haemolyticus]
MKNMQATLNQISALLPIPMHLQVKGMQVFQKVKQRVTQAQPFPDFVEKPIPDVATLKLEDIDMSNPFLYRQHQWQSYFKRLRDERPVHYQKSSPFGAFWSITRYDDIVFVDKSHELFSAEPVIVIGKPPAGLDVEMFIAMDPPKHDVQRQAVQGVVAPKNLKEMEGLIRSRVQEILDDLPLDTPFDWVERVSKEITARMLATLLDFPYEQRHKLVYWSDTLAGSAEATGGEISDNDVLFNAAADMAKQFAALWHAKAAQQAAGEPMGFDLISLMLSNDDTKDLIHRPMEFLGNLALLIVGGNDTTRNSMTGGVYALNLFPEQFVKLKNQPSLIPNMVSEIIRWQTPLAYMRRIAKQDIEMHGQTIRKGDKILMWYASGNRDERVIEQPDAFLIDRKGARNHLSFGFGVHRCMGNRLAEMQLRILWEELLLRFDNIEVLGEPELVQSNFVRGYAKMMVKLTAKA